LIVLVMRGQKRVEGARERACHPRIHRKKALPVKEMDCRVKPGNDGGWVSAKPGDDRCGVRSSSAVEP